VSALGVVISRFRRGGKSECVRTDPQVRVIRDAIVRHERLPVSSHAFGLPSASNREITTPSADTLYTAVWLDVAKEPGC